MDEGQIVEDGKAPFLGMHRFLLLIVLSIIIAAVLVVIGMMLYSSSGAAQLDLSRPGYQSIRSQVVTSDTNFQDYPNLGQIDQNSMSEFKTLYEQQAQKAKAVDAFGGDPLNPDSLAISATSEQ